MKAKKLSKSAVQKMLRSIVDHPTYRKAYEDPDFMHREELRPIRMQLEMLKPEMALTELDIRSTIVVFGSARIRPRPVALRAVEELRRKLRARPRSGKLKRLLAAARRLLAMSKYYEEARRFAHMVTRASQADQKRDFVIVTGGGPGIMEAANRGAWEAGGKSIGLNITLPHEQEPNHYMTPELSFQFHYFALRKMHFMMRARAMVAFPGGFGTFDELFEALTLVQVDKKQPLPIVLFGKEYWRRIVDFPAMAAHGVIGHQDLNLISYVETAEQAWDRIRHYWKERGGVPARRRKSIVATHLDPDVPPIA